MLQVRMKVGAVGYAIYFMLLERLRDEDDYMSVKDYNAIAFDLRVDTSQIKAVVEDFGLFVFTDDGKYFYSEGFNKRMALKDEKSKRRSEAGKKGAKSRWGGNSKPKSSANNSNAIAMPSDSDGKESKVKESKGKDKSNTRPHSAKPKYGPNDRPYQIAQHLLKAIRANDEDFKPKLKDSDIQHWANDIRLAHTQDGHDYDKLDGMVDWCQNSDFWQSNVLSGSGLRNNFDSMRAQAIREVKSKTSKPTRAKETLPGWAQSGATPTATRTELTPEQQEKINARIARLQQNRKPEQEAAT